MRPVIQKAVARVAGEIVQQGLLTWNEVMSRMSELDWRLSELPWVVVYSVEGKKMVGAKDHANLLGDLLHVHLAPASVQAIKRVQGLQGFIRSTIPYRLKTNSLSVYLR